MRKKATPKTAEIVSTPSTQSLCGTIGALAERMHDLQRQAAYHYQPVVDDILRSRTRDAKKIEHTLDGLLDFCGHAPVLEMYKQLCRHYWDIDPAATADYVNAYREYWGSEENGRQT